MERLNSAVDCGVTGILVFLFKKVGLQTEAKR